MASSPQDSSERFSVPPQADTTTLTREEPLGGPTSKRTPKRRALESRAATTYPRKRALAACETCRRRKSKCDNQRPACGFCQSAQVECDYRDGTFNHSSYDLASLEILDKIDYIARLLEQHDGKTTHQPVVFPTHQHGLETGTRVAEGDISLQPELQDDAIILAESLEFTGTNSGTCEDVLEWPIFESRFRRSETEKLIFNPRRANNQCSGFPQQSHFVPSGEPDCVRKSGPGRGINEGDALVLVQTFLWNVHIKNPVLDAEEMRARAREVMENGFRWDGTSCLVLIACALACLSSPYSAEFITPSLFDGENPVSSVDDASDYSTAENYYIASQKRVSLLEPSILAVQCCFFSGVYEMYSMRPMRAWTSFNRACITLQLYLRSKTGTDLPAQSRLERRLYWSCLKSECEIRVEICLPPSGLAKINYPDVFPTPPVGSPVPDRDSSADGSFTASPVVLDPDLEKSWSYYLSDIAVRRIGNRLINYFYKEKESSWLHTPVDRMIRVAQELDLQLTQWYNHLPSLVGTDVSSYTSSAAEELTHLLHVRLLEFRELLYRPFLYIATHQPASSPVQAIIEPYVQRCLDACLQQTLKGSHRHRHHGSWYQNRKIFAECLLILAAVKSKRVNVPAIWREAVTTSISGLRFWETEAPDLGKARLILQSILDELDCDRDVTCE